MQRPHIVAVGGTEDQPIDCLYCGADGAEAVAAFQAAANDGRNELVRLFMYPDYTRIAMPKQHDVPPAEVLDLEAEFDADVMTAELEAAVKRVVELKAAVAECERSHKADLARIADLEKALAKATKKTAAAQP